MILTLACGLAFHSNTAADFFPLVTGTLRRYEQKTGDLTQVVNIVGKGMDMGGAMAIPMTETPMGHSPTVTYYRVDGDQVVIIANDLKHPLPSPMPILKVGPGKVEWDFRGATQTGPQGELLQVHGESHLAGQREVLGKKVDIIDVKLSFSVGSGMTQLIYEQHTIYARGLGMVEMTTKARLGKGKPQPEQVTRLVSIEEPKQGS